MGRAAIHTLAAAKRNGLSAPDRIISNLNIRRRTDSMPQKGVREHQWNRRRCYKVWFLRHLSALKRGYGSNFAARDNVYDAMLRCFDCGLIAIY